jgi:hypothetical protein
VIGEQSCASSGNAGALQDAVQVVDKFKSRMYFV